jgi:integrase
MAKQELTAKGVAALKAEQRIEIWDTICPGLVLRAGPRGKVWAVVFTGPDGVKRRQGLGKFPAVTLEAARRAARVAVGAVAGGEMPVPVVTTGRGVMTVSDLVKLYMEKHSKPSKTTWKADEGVFRRHVLPLIGTEKVTAVTRRRIRDLVERLEADGKDRTAKIVLTLVSGMFNWAIGQDHIEANPCKGVKVSQAAVKRDRVLSDAEVADLWAMLDNPETPMGLGMRQVFRLLLLTGQRVGEVSGMNLSELDLDGGVWMMPPERTKNRRPHLVPLVGEALAVVKAAAARADGAGFLFSHVEGQPYESNAASHALRRAYEAREMEVDWTPHDLRRSAATRMAAAGVVPHVIEAVLNHVSGSQSGVAGIYNRHSYSAEKKAALEALEADVAGTVKKVNAQG